MLRSSRYILVSLLLFIYETLSLDDQRHPTNINPDFFEDDLKVHDSHSQQIKNDPSINLGLLLTGGGVFDRRRAINPDQSTKQDQSTNQDQSMNSGPNCVIDDKYWDISNSACIKSDPASYTEKKATAKNGVPCINWSDAKNNGYYYGKDKYCRLTAYSYNGPWCYVTPTEWTYCYTARDGVTSIPVRVFQLNTWHSGRKVNGGTRKVIDEILRSEASIVFMQEIENCAIANMLKEVSEEWTVMNNNEGDCSNVLIATKFPVEEQYTNSTYYGSPPGTSIGGRVRISDSPRRVINLWNNHLDYINYGPYEACKKSTNFDEIYRHEYFTASKTEPINGRVLGIHQLLSFKPFYQNLLDAQGEGMDPMILGGDFNTPSHLDWVEATKEVNCGLVYEWPTTKVLETVGFVDSFREAHPDPVTNPGDTWSPTEVMSKQDRIDFLFQKGNNIQTVSSVITTGNETVVPYPDYVNNAWPSDHAGLISVFEIS